MNVRFIATATLLGTLGCACSPGDGQDRGSLVVFNAGSLSRPLRAALDTFAARRGVRIDQENAGSLETARKLTELGKIPDVIALADYEVFPQLLMPRHVTWYARFARNRMVLAYTDRSRFADHVNADNWWRVLQQPGVEVGRSDPNLDPAGYRTLMVYQLAERHYAQPGLAERLVAISPRRNMRPKEADLIALLQAGELDYAWEYESLAQAAGLRYVELPHQIDLGTQADSSFYRLATVRVFGASPTDSLTLRGDPIVYALSIPTHAPHPVLGREFVLFLLSKEGQAILRAERLDALDLPTLAGTNVPPELARLLGQ